MKTKRKIKIGKSIFVIVMFSIMALWCFTVLFALVWALITSLKTRGDFVLDPFGLPEHGWQFENYVKAFLKMGVPIAKDGGTDVVLLPQLFLNSLIYSVFTPFVGTFSNMMVAYVVCKYKNRVSKVLHAFVIVQMTITIVGSLSGSLLYIRSLNMYDSYLWYLYRSISFGGGNFLIFYAAFKGVSNTYSEAAKIDGAGPVTTAFAVVIPMIIKTFIVLWLLGFIASWQDYMTPMIWLPSMPTAAYGLYIFQNDTSTVISSIPMQMTACMLLSIPTIILFLFFRNSIMGNMNLGGLKE